MSVPPDQVLAGPGAVPAAPRPPIHRTSASQRGRVRFGRGDVQRSARSWACLSSALSASIARSRWPGVIWTSGMRTSRMPGSPPSLVPEFGMAPDRPGATPCASSQGNGVAARRTSPRRWKPVGLSQVCNSRGPRIRRGIRLGSPVTNACPEPRFLGAGEPRRAGSGPGPQRAHWTPRQGARKGTRQGPRSRNCRIKALCRPKPLVSALPPRERENPTLEGDSPLQFCPARIVLANWREADLSIPQTSWPRRPAAPRASCSPT